MKRVWFRKSRGVVGWVVMVMASFVRGRFVLWQVCCLIQRMVRLLLDRF